MGSLAQAALDRLRDSRLAKLGIRAPFTIPSGIVTTVPSVIARIARDIPEIGFLTTKTLSVEPRAGYREPILYEYQPGCFVNAVGLANPGAAKFRDAMKPLLPLHDAKPLIVSIMGGNPEEFLECALILEPIADVFELNLSCPHVKGAGQSVGSDPEAVRGILRALRGRSGKPLIPKLSPNLGDVGSMARLCETEGAAALTLINTVGPGTACDADGNPVLFNINGGLSGAGVLPIGLRAVREAASQVDIPIIACGGIGSPEDVIAYFKAGACLFGVGSALAGQTTTELASFFKALATGHHGLPDAENKRGSRFHSTRTLYVKMKVAENIVIGRNLFRLALETGLPCDPGQFFFLRLPDVGEKPFSPAAAVPAVYLVRTVGPFTSALANLKAGDSLYMRGPYGQGFPQPQPMRPLVLVAGGTGAAPLLMAAASGKKTIAAGFFGFSAEIAAPFRAEIMRAVPGARVVIDPPNHIGEVVKALKAHVLKETDLYTECLVFLCGPEPMMNAAVEALKDRVPRERIFTAREDIMRCGIGVCGSCGTSGGLRSCVDGPVMRSKECYW